MKSERRSIDMLINTGENAPHSPPIWKCSSTQADLLRNKSWKCVLGATIPHLFEMMKNTYADNPSCKECDSITRNENYLTITVPYG